MGHFDVHRIHITVAYEPAARLWGAFESVGVTLEPVWVRGKLDFAAISAIRRIIRKQKAKVLHTQGPGSVDFFATIAAKREGAAIVVTRPVMLTHLKVGAINERCMGWLTATPSPDVIDLWRYPKRAGSI